jgi:hypothetical protein
MVMVVLAAGRLEARAAVADVDPLDEPELDELVEDAVDGGDPDRAAFLAHALVQLLGADAAGLLGHRVEHGGTGAA